MKCILNVNIKGSSNIRFSCGEQEFEILGDEKSEIAFDIPKPGVYEIKIIEFPTAKLKIIEWFIYFVVSIVELAFDLFTFSWNFAWQKEVTPYCFCAVLKVQISNDRKIGVDICDSEYKGVWQFPKVKIKNLSSENFSIEYFFNEFDFKNAIIHYIIKLSILVLPLSAFFGLAMVSYILSKKLLPLLFVTFVLALFVGFYVYQLNKLKKGYKKEIQSAKNKLNNIKN